MDVDGLQDIGSDAATLITNTSHSNSAAGYDNSDLLYGVWLTEA